MATLSPYPTERKVRKSNSLAAYLTHISFLIHQLHVVYVEGRENTYRAISHLGETLCLNVNNLLPQEICLRYFSLFLKLRRCWEYVVQRYIVSFKRMAFLPFR